MPINRYPSYFIFFILIWLLIILLHAIFKNDLTVFGYMQSFFYGICFYIILKYNTAIIKPRELLNSMYKIYGVLLATLLVEFIINLLGKGNLLLDLFSVEAAGKGYQVIESRILTTTFDYELLSMNSIFLGPQSASMLVFMCLLFYNPFDKLLPEKNWIKMVICLFLYIVCSTMTVTLIFIIFLVHFTYFSRHSSLRKHSAQFLMIFLVLVSGSTLVSVFFYNLGADAFQDWYVERWTIPFIAMFNLGIKEFLIGIPGNVEIGHYTQSHEIGLILVLFISGIMPIVFLLSLASFMLIKLAKYRRSLLLQLSTTYRDLYQSARLSVFIFSLCIFSLVHYAAMFSTGFFQLIGFHIAITFFCFDLLNYPTASVGTKVAQSS